MASRNLSDEQYALERDTVKLYARGVGAATSNLTGVKGKGITSIVRTGTGAHTITITDQWNGLLAFSACIIDPGTTDDWEVTVVSEAVAHATTRELKIAIFKGGTATDLSTDETILMEITVSNTAQLPTGY